MKFFTVMLLTSALVSCRQGGELANESLNGGKITDGTVSELKIADASVTPAKLDRAYQESLPVSGNAGDYLTGNLVWADLATAVRGSVSAQLMPVTPLLYDPGTGVFALDTVSPAFGGTGLTSLGTPNQVLGVNNAGTQAEYKSIVGTGDQVIVNHIGSDITLSTPQNIAATSRPSFSGLDLTSDLSAAVDDGILNDTSVAATLSHTTAGLPVAGFGTTLEFRADRADNVLSEIAQISARWTNPAAGATLNSELAFSTISQGVNMQSLVIAPEGSIRVQAGISTSYASVTGGPLTIEDIDSVLGVDTSSGPITINLPSAAGREGRQFTIKRVAGPDAVTINAVDLIDGAGSVVLANPFDYIVVVSSGTTWLIVGQDLIP